MNNKIFFAALAAILIALSIVLILYLSIPKASKAISIGVSVRFLNNTKPLYPYSLSKMQIYIKNNGENPILNLPMIIYFNHVPYSFFVSIPGDSYVVKNFTYMYNSSGTYTFSIKPDPAMLLPIANRSSFNKTYIVNVLSNSTLAPYDSLPQSNASNSSYFSISPKSLIYLGITGAYGISNERTAGISYALIPIINYTKYVGIAYNAYKNGTEEYAVWLQGTLNPASLEGLLLQENRNFSVESAGNASLLLTNKSSFCIFYSGGWTKLVILNKPINASSCRQISTFSANTNFSSGLNFTYKQKFLNFVYLNSTPMGQLLWHSSSGVYRAANIFGNSAGVFLSVIVFGQNFSKPANLSCNGSYYLQGATSICSKQVNISLPNKFIMLNQTEVTNHSILTLYSLVNSSLYDSAAYSGIKLISYLNLTGLHWNISEFNPCNFSNKNLSCKLEFFNPSSSIASLLIGNSFSKSIKLDGLSCGIPGLGRVANESIEIPSGSSSLVNVSCRNLPIPSTYSYIVNASYSINNKTYYTNGTLKINSNYFK
ncbi:MAG: hypothetical protein ACP5LP_00495 [Candidatus Micrarchaeia archaeon]